jgi:hypothetical protein
MRPALPTSIFVVLFCSCASSSNKGEQVTPTSPPPTSAHAAPALREPEPVAPAPKAEVQKKQLGAGQCLESFDCVDTIGFPPAGQRWTCVEGKCGHTKLPDLGQATPVGDADAGSPTASNDEQSPKNPPTKKTKGKHH